MSDPVAIWLEANAGDYGFPWVIQLLVSFFLMIFSFGGVIYLIDRFSVRDGEYFLTVIVFPLMILMLFLSFRALFFARRLRIDSAGLEVRPVGIVIAADEILAIDGFKSGRRLKISVKVDGISPSRYLPGYLNLKPNAYELRTVLK